MSTTEIVPATESPIAETRVSITDQLLAKFGAAKIVKQVTRTVLQQRDGIPFGVHFESAAIESNVQTEGRGGKPKMEAARVANVINLETRAHQILIMNTVLEGELDRNYPNMGYVGKSFLCNGYKPVDSDGKERRYKVYEIIEIEVDDLTGVIEGKELVSDASDPVNRRGDKPKG